MLGHGGSATVGTAVARSLNAQRAHACSAEDAVVGVSREAVATVV